MERRGAERAGGGFARSSPAQMLSHAYATGSGSTGRHGSTFPFQIPASGVSLAPVKGTPSNPPSALLISQGGGALAAWAKGTNLRDSDPLGTLLNHLVSMQPSCL